MNQELLVAKKFDEAWTKPDSAQLVKLLHPETVLYQPHLAPIRGIANAHREFELFLQWMPEFSGEVIECSGSNNLLYITWWMRFKFGKKVVSIRAIDQIKLEDGLIKERAVYFNPLELIKILIRRPQDWRRYFAYRFARRH